jgi:hypothetical protein
VLVTARLIPAAVASLVGWALHPVLGVLATATALCALIASHRTVDSEPNPVAQHSEAVKALERIATKALTGQRRRGGRRR